MTRAPPAVDEVVFPSTDSHRAGSPGAPTAAAGYLCIYIAIQGNAYWGSTTRPIESEEPGNLNFTASPFGAILVVEPNTTGTVIVRGSWAVTAP